jgi:tRNA pseudouridine38-40 synthase
LGQVAHFRELPRLQPKNLLPALNNNLPESIRVHRASFAPNSFHARFSATGKEYHYHIVNRPISDPFQADLAWHIYRPLDLDAIRATFPLLTGTHDFASYTSNPGYKRENTIRTITGIHLKRTPEGLKLVFRGEGFLYRMVRNLVGAMVKVGHHRLQPADIATILKACKRSEAPPTAPAHGLYLARVFYSKVPS